MPPLGLIPTSSRLLPDSEARAMARWEHGGGFSVDGSAHIDALTVPAVSACSGCCAADCAQPAEVEAKTERLREKIATLREQTRRMDTIREELKHKPDEQISLTDPDSRSMISQAKGSGIVGYNVQAVVDATHHLIVTHESDVSVRAIPS